MLVSRAARVLLAVSAISVLPSCFAEQRAVIEDNATRKCALCPRRAGKTEMAGHYLVEEAQKGPGVCLYIDTTRLEAAHKMVRIVQRILAEYRIEASYNASTLQWAFPGGGEIWLSGADNLSDIDRFRGHAYRLVILDESSSYGGYLTELLEEVLYPALDDYNGTLLMVGTPGRIQAGAFWDASNDLKFSQHRWKRQDNPYFPAWAGLPNWRAVAADTMERIRKDLGLELTDPVWLREYCGVWAIDPSKLLYVYHSAINAAHITSWNGWVHVLGADLGFRDAAALVDVSYHREQLAAIIHDEEYGSGWDITDVATRIKARMAKRKYSMMVCDTAGHATKMISAELRNRWQIPMDDSPKQEKTTYIDFLAADLKRGLLQVDEATAPTWIAQAAATEWDEKRQREAEGQPCDVLDAALYAYRQVYHYLSRPTEAKTIEQITAEMAAKDRADHIKKATEAYNEQREKRIRGQVVGRGKGQPGRRLVGRG